MAYEPALAYAERHDLHALVVGEGWTIPLERYGAAWGASMPHPLYSGAKSFWGVLAAALHDDGALDLDAPVAATIGEWADDPLKRTMRVYQLLDLTSGFGFGGLGTAVPPAAKALATPLKTAPGTAFTYGGVPLQVFGEVLRRKLGREPHETLHERLLEPLGIPVPHWRAIKDGTRPLPTGASVDARSWLRYGTFLLNEGAVGTRRYVSAEGFARVVTGSAANPAYGLGIWLGTARDGTPFRYASGAGGQGLYVVPSRRLVAVHFGKSSSWRHDAFVRALLEA